MNHDRISFQITFFQENHKPRLFHETKKERLEGLEEKVNQLDEKISSVATNDFTVSG